jgi:hypothetical protein
MRTRRAALEIHVKRGLENYDPLVVTPLCRIMKRRGSDKALGWHNYTTLYHHLFEHLRERKLYIFELGIGSNHPDIPSSMGPDGVPGASLRGWAEYFPRARVFGGDADIRVLFEEDRIRTFYCDQRLKTSVRAMWRTPALAALEFDVIVEDGLHEFGAAATFLENSLQKLAPGGVYVTEDLTEATRRRLRRKLPEWRRRFPGVRFDVVEMPNTLNTYDNSLLIAHRAPAASGARR